MNKSIDLTRWQALVNQDCRHTETQVITGEWGPHRAKRICKNCGFHIKWEKALVSSKYQGGVN